MNAYDFDKTIYRNDSSTDFFLFCMVRHPKILLLVPGIIAGFAKHYIFKKCSKTEFKEKIMKFVKFIDLEKDVSVFWKKNKKKIKKFYLENQHEDDVIISASPYFLLEPICKELGINHLIASKVSTHDGSFEGLNCHGEEKVRRFREVFGNSAVDEFYSDSYSDAPMAETASKAFIVKGNRIENWKF